MLQQWAAAVASPSRGRLTALALGSWADSMVRGARALFGAAIDEVIVASPAVPSTGDSLEVHPSEPIPRDGAVRFEADPVAAGRYLAGWSETLTSADRVLVLLSPGDDAAVAWPMEPVAMEELAQLLASAHQPARVRARLDGLMGGGLAALLGTASMVGVGWRGDDPDYGPLGDAPPSGRSVEIELRRAGVTIPFGVVMVLRSEDGAHPADGAARLGPRHRRWLEPGTESLEATLAEARARGASATVLTDTLRGDPVAAGRGMARVAQAVADGLGGLALPAVALAAGRLDGGSDRHDLLRRSARSHLGHDRALVESWTPVAGAPDLVAVVVTDPAGRGQPQSESERNATGI